MSDDTPLAVSIPEHHGIARGPRCCLTVSDIRERVVPGADTDIAVGAIVLLTERDSRIGPLPRILEVFGNGRRGGGHGLRCRAPQNGVRVIHRGYTSWIAAVVCGAPGRRSCGDLVLVSGAAITAARRAA